MRPSQETYIVAGNGPARPLGAAVMEFHVSRTTRDRYQIDTGLFALNGNVIVANFQAARALAQKLNARRDLLHFPEQAVKAGQINALGLIDEVLHFVVSLYRDQKNAAVLRQALSNLQTQFGVATVDAALKQFVAEFPPLTVYRGDIDAVAYLDGESDGVPHRHLVLEEMLLLGVTNLNPASAPFQELFDDEPLEKETAYLPIFEALHAFFGQQPPFGPDDQNLVDMLRSPAVAVPHSLKGQLDYIRERWGYLLGKHLYRLLGGLDLLREEEKGALFGGGGPGPSIILEYGALEGEPEAFSPDREWMPRVVLLAKNTYVWLDQLSRQYQRPIQRLDQIPDEELATLGGRGFNGLWLIGLWERSRASQKIKQLCGNPGAVASAYSLHDYHIAADLGGEEAYQNLASRAAQHGLRLASDMVPNHMGIDSRWLVEHPDWFLSLDQPPYPSYTFNGPDLSQDGRVGIFLEDHYYNRSDAAVVFRRHDRATGQDRFVYHGNDGTSMPWNDTAQLNFLNPEVREAVIQTILHVARKFPIIRFDAAMTLAKKHYQRLWFPEAGSGGAIPSRAEHGMTKAQFDALMPKEFWREVVDRAAKEAPDTLLLAEAFWMMEGYFVRTLGMHRVYNSAFMNMLKREENANYRSVLKNTLEFNPQVLKRFVNFMNNPDEDTAVAQFGRDGKYFGVCTMMATLPGLPMFGHGQVEGYTEKYGMEFRRAYKDETPDAGLVQRHEREIFPLLRKRHLFAEVDNFLLYDFWAMEGSVNEDVFAYSNRVGAERALVVYHNKYATAKGWIRTSAGFRSKTGIIQKTLAEGLQLHAEADYFTIARDQVSGLEYIRNSKELVEKGLYLELGAFRYLVLLDIREVKDDERSQYAHLTAYLDRRGVPSIEEALREVFLQPIQRPFLALVNAPLFRKLREGDREALNVAEKRLVELFRAVKQFSGGSGIEIMLAREVRRELEAALQLLGDKGVGSLFGGPEVDRSDPSSAEKTPDPFVATAQSLRSGLEADDWTAWGGLFGWAFVHALGKVAAAAPFAEQSRSWIDEWQLGRLLTSVMRELGLDEAQAASTVTAIKWATSHQRWFATEAADGLRAGPVLRSLLRDQEVQQFLQVNRYQDVLWYSKEAFARLRWWLELLTAVEALADPDRVASEVAARLETAHQVVETLRQAGEGSANQVETLLEALGS
jgi:glycosidase